MSEAVEIKEKLALLLMSDSDDSKRFVIYIVYQTIKKNQSITINQLCQVLTKHFFIPRERIESAVAVLTSQQLFNSVSKFEEKPGVVHLRCKESLTLSEWLSAFCKKIPEACNFDAPMYKMNKNGSVNGSTTIAKV